jgi:5-formyltetrahydrofolate cyclo-ligase
MKQALRQSIIAARQKMTVTERDEFSRVILKRIMQLDAYKRAKMVLAYMSFGAEFASGAWVQQALQDGKQVFLPRVNDSTKQLELFQLVDLQQDIAPGKWDIPEPLPERCRRVDDSERIDFILLPGVAFARDGSRLGYGGGYYDKLLARIAPDSGDRHPALVAAAFSIQLVKNIPQETTDRKVEWLITESEVLDCGTEQNRFSD